jgi:DNA mismatch repair protein MutL
MKKVILLPPEVFQKIAAGEVIERPFSVVKELVENALDALSTDVKVEVIEGGKELIRVMDNGHGMAREDAILCFERHSTSKISGEDDLEKISTLGFRGEALPSISAVSRVTMKSSDGRGEKGIQVDREGEKVLRTFEIGFPKGTCVEVRDLFFNLPARRKFLRSSRAELSQIVKFMTQFALAFSEVRFSLYHGGREIFDYPAVSSLKERIYQIYGRSVLESLIPVDYKDEERCIHGYVSRPPTGRKDRSRQLFYVNRRMVKDRMLQAALNQAFSGYLEKDMFAESFLFIDLPFSEVDVNVHPTKAEVRFQDSSSIFRLVQRGITQSISREIGIKDVYPAQDEERESPRIEETYQPPLMKSPDVFENQVTRVFVPESAEKMSRTVLGQYLDTYIVMADEEGLLIVDQHNAHERVLFEKYAEIDRQRKWPRKLTLLPAVFDLSPSQALSFERSQELLEEIGFRVDNMGGRSFALKEYPDIFMEDEALQIFLSLLEEMSESKIQDKKRALLATIACKTAVKAGQPLSHEKMSYLVEKLFATSNPSLCPHGRPVLLKLERKKIEKEIGRKS